MTVDLLSERDLSGFPISVRPVGSSVNQETEDEKHVNRVLECSPFAITEEMYSTDRSYWFQLKQNNSQLLNRRCVSDKVGLSNAARAENDLNCDF